MFDTNLSVVVSTPSTLDNRIHLERGDSIEFEVSENMESVQWRSNHLRDDWSNIYSFDSGDSSGELSIIDIISQIEHLPGIAVMGNHTISLRGIQHTSDTSSSSPLVTAEIMVMDDSKNPVVSASSDGFSSGTIVLVSVAGVVLFLLALLLVSLISNREEGALAGKDLRNYLDAQILDAVDSDLSENQYWEEKA